jgi:Cell division protein FtsI/penicillin-binding protein 2
MNQDEHKIMVRRMAALIAVASVLIAVYVLRLIFLQLVNGESFKAQATNTTDYNFTVTAARGDIVDSAGRRIAASTTSYNVVLSKLLMGDQDLDTMLQKVVDLLEAHGESWNDSLLIGEPDAAGHYSFTAQADSTSDQKALAAMKDSLGLQQYATADDVMEKLVEDYKLEKLSPPLAEGAGRHPLRDAAAGVLQRQQLRHGRECQRSDRGDHQGEQPDHARCGDRRDQHPQLR